MIRIKKAILVTLRSMGYHSNRLRLYYWSEIKLYELRTVYIMPRWYYRWLYHTCEWLVEFSKFRRLADRAIHTIPLHVRFEMS